MKNDIYSVTNENLVPFNELKKRVELNTNIKVVNRLRCIEKFFYSWVFTTLLFFMVFFACLSSLYALNLLIVVENIPDPLSAILNTIIGPSNTKITSSRQCNLLEINTCSLDEIDIQIKRELDQI